MTSAAIPLMNRNQSNNNEFILDPNLRCSFTDTSFKKYMETNKKIAYVIARIHFLNRSVESPLTLADAHALHFDWIAKGRLDNVVKIQYFTNFPKQNKDSDHFTALTTIEWDEGKRPKSLFPEHYMVSCRKKIDDHEDNELLTSRKYVINYFLDNNHFKEAAFWAEQTSNDFPDNDFTPNIIKDLMKKRMHFENSEVLIARGKAKGCNFGKVVSYLAGAGAGYLLGNHLQVIFGLTFAYCAGKVCLSHGTILQSQRLRCITDRFVAPLYKTFFLETTIESIVRVSIDIAAPPANNINTVWRSANLICGIVANCLNWEISSCSSCCEDEQSPRDYRQIVDASV